MPNDPYANLDPVFRARLKVFESELLKRNIRAEPTSGYRSMAAQRALYAQGRTAPGRIVTKAKPGSSAHNFGMAMDYVPVVGHRTYHVKPLWWVKFGLAARAARLAWGGLWKFRDRCHVELPDWRKRVYATHARHNPQNGL